MGKDIIMDLDNVAVRFTSEGKISVIDAIRAISSLEYPWSVWKKLKTEHTEILDHCEFYSFHAEDPVPVVDSDGLQKMLIVLLKYVPEYTLKPFMQ